MELLLDRIRKIRDCEVLPSHGLPNISNLLPSDLVEFYKLCGGVKLFKNEEYCVEIVCPEELVLANPVIVGELCPEDISSQWYIIAKGGAEESITIDLAPERLGRCYDSFVDVHAVAGSCSIIALSFHELLERLIINKGKYWYWLRDDFQSLGDAYD
ncbi:SMI1/KNR4 family protein [Celerinatantimonas sp. MCCC 1A17872]|uniref:SMI1/KNR4 family protein n=1 Tax=Celerinatantimonas sp. MCCC 1A17872 TaxID=3177514 RepID=UPI0038C5F925